MSKRYQGGGSALAFDADAYGATLSWLGHPLRDLGIAAVCRPFGDGHCDLRGSWPYQSLPGLEGLLRLQKLCPTPLSYTAVIRPDIGAEVLASSLKSIDDRFAMTCKPLKPHLAHLPDRRAACETYSSRTRNRLAQANEIFTVAREALGTCHMIMADWQKRLKALRGIPDQSSPDAAHFKCLIAAQLPNEFETAAVTLRWRTSGEIAGIFLFVSSSGSASWHAHSFLVAPEAIDQFGSYLLFDAALGILGAGEMWFGGAPAGPNGEGVFRFKQRFTNAFRSAHIISIDLDPKALTEVRAQSGRFAWLPDYHNPELATANLRS